MKSIFVHLSSLSLHWLIFKMQYAMFMHDISKSVTCLFPDFWGHAGLWLSIWKHSNQGFDFDNKKCILLHQMSLKLSNLDVNDSYFDISDLFDFLIIMDFILRNEHHTEKWEC